MKALRVEKCGMFEYISSRLGEIDLESVPALKKGDFLFIPCDEVVSGFKTGPSADTMLVTLAPPAGTGPNRIKFFAHFRDLAVRRARGEERWHLQVFVNEVAGNMANVQTPSGEMVGAVFEVDWLSELRLAILVGGDIWAAEMIQPSGKLFGQNKRSR